MRFYTWKDIERYILLHCTQWNSHICDIDVYPDEIIVYSKIIHMICVKSIT